MMHWKRAIKEVRQTERDYFIITFVQKNEKIVANCCAGCISFCYIIVFIDTKRNLKKWTLLKKSVNNFCRRFDNRDNENIIKFSIKEKIDKSVVL